MVCNFLLFVSAFFISCCSSMQSSSGTPGSSLTPSPSSNGVSEAHFVGCAEVERKYLSMMIQVEAARIATRAADSFLSDDRFANGKFRQHFQSQYPAHRKAVMAWYRRFLQQLPLTEPVAFQLQCHGAENQCYEDIYAVTDFTRKTVILVRLLYHGVFFTRIART